MIKKEYIASIGLALLSVAFVAISLLLYLNKNNRWLVARKIKLGASMLTLSAIITACTSGTPPDDIEIISCYEPTVIEDTLINYEDSDTLSANEIDPEDIKVEIIDTSGTLKMPNNAVCYGAPASWGDSTKY